MVLREGIKVGMAVEVRARTSVGSRDLVEVASAEGSSSVVARCPVIRRIRKARASNLRKDLRLSKAIIKTALEEAIWTAGVRSRSPSCSRIKAVVGEAEGDGGEVEGSTRAFFALLSDGVLVLGRRDMRMGIYVL